jgi:hypothetical protein
VSAASSNASGRPRYRRLEAADYVTIVRQHLRGLSNRRIGDDLDVDESTVRRALKRPVCLELIERLQRTEAPAASSKLTAGSETEGLVRLHSPDGTISAWHEPSEVDALLKDGWLPA